MTAQVQINGGSRGRHCVRSPTGKSNSLYTPTCTASDREEEEIENSELDLSDYYSDSGYPTRPRPRHILWTSSSRQLRTVVAENGLQRRASTSTSNGHRSIDYSQSSSRSRRQSVPILPGAREVTTVKSKAFSKLRSLRNNRVIPVAAPERQRPPSSLVTNCLSASGNNKAAHVVVTSPEEGRPKQLRSFSVPSGSLTDVEEMAQAKLKKAKKVGRALSFSLGTGDRKKRARSIFGALGRNNGGSSGGETLAISEPPPVTKSPVLMGRKRTAGDTTTIYEEDKASLSSTEEQEDRLGSLSYLHGNRFGSCRELTSAGLDEEETNQRLRPLSTSRHKRPSLPSFTRLPAGCQESPTGSQMQSASSSLPTEPEKTETTTHGASGPPSSPSRGGKVLRRKLSDPGSASSTPEAGNSPTTERRVGREEGGSGGGGGGGGLTRGNRPRRKGFTFSVGGSNLSPDWVSCLPDPLSVVERWW